MASDVDIITKHFAEIKSIHDTNMYPPRIKVTVKIKDNIDDVKLQIKVKGSNNDENLSTDLFFPFRGMSTNYMHKTETLNLYRSQ